MITIYVDNNKTRIQCKLRTLLTLREHKLLCRKSKSAFFSEAFRKRIWDGYIRDISETGVIDTGKLPQVLEILREMKKKVAVHDVRAINVDKPEKIITKLGEFEARDYQKGSLISILENDVYGLPFPRGLLGMATNAGKSLISALIYANYKRKTLYLLNSKDLFEDAMREMPKLLPNKVGWMHSKEIVWNDFMIVMVPTAKNRLNDIKRHFPQYPIVLVDEGDLATSKSYKIVLSQCYNAYVKIALSGSFNRHKDPDKDETIRKYFGEMLYEIRNKDLIEKGHSAKMNVTIFEGNTTVKIKGDYVAELEEGLISNKDRNRKILKRAIYHAKKKHIPMLILAQRHDHIKNLLKIFTKSKKLEGLRIEWLHHKREGRKEIQDKFANGEIDILIGSMIIKRGKNFPLMRYLCNAGGGDSQTNILQGPIGRASRKSNTKKGTYIEDFFDQGAYLRRHSVHRLKVYKDEGLKVIERCRKIIKL